MKSLITKSQYKVTVHGYTHEYYSVFVVSPKGDCVTVTMDKDELLSFKKLIEDNISVQELNAQTP